MQQKKFNADSVVFNQVKSRNSTRLKLAIDVNIGTLQYIT